MGPQGLSTWRIGIQARIFWKTSAISIVFWIQKVQQTSHFPWKLTYPLKIDGCLEDEMSFLQMVPNLGGRAY